EPGLTIVATDDLVTRPLQVPGDETAVRLVVVHHQDPRHQRALTGARPPRVRASALSTGTPSWPTGRLACPSQAALARRRSRCWLGVSEAGPTTSTGVAASASSSQLHGWATSYGAAGGENAWSNSSPSCSSTVGIVPSAV